MAQLGDVCDRCLRQTKGAKRSGSDLPIGELQSNDDRGLVTTERALRRDVPERLRGRSHKTEKFNIEVWLSLVERYVREQIADYERKIYKTAETP